MASSSKSSSKFSVAEAHVAATMLRATKAAAPVDVLAFIAKHFDKELFMLVSQHDEAGFEQCATEEQLAGLANDNERKERVAQDVRHMKSTIKQRLDALTSTEAVSLPAKAAQLVQVAFFEEPSKDGFSAHISENCAATIESVMAFKASLRSFITKIMFGIDGAGRPSAEQIFAAQLHAAFTLNGTRDNLPSEVMAALTKPPASSFEQLVAIVDEACSTYMRVNERARSARTVNLVAAVSSSSQGSRTSRWRNEKGGGGNEKGGGGNEKGGGGGGEKKKKKQKGVCWRCEKPGHTRDECKEAPKDDEIKNAQRQLEKLLKQRDAEAVHAISVLERHAVETLLGGEASVAAASGGGDGRFHVDIVITTPSANEKRAVSMLVDSGASRTLVSKYDVAAVDIVPWAGAARDAAQRPLEIVGTAKMTLSARDDATTTLDVLVASFVARGTGILGIDAMRGMGIGLAGDSLRVTTRSGEVLAAVGENADVAALDARDWLAAAGIMPSGAYDYDEDEAAPPGENMSLQGDVRDLGAFLAYNEARGGLKVDDVLLQSELLRRVVERDKAIMKLEPIELREKASSAAQALPVISPYDQGATLEAAKNRAVDRALQRGWVEKMDASEIKQHIERGGAIVPILAVPKPQRGNDRTKKKGNEVEVRLTVDYKRGGVNDAFEPKPARYPDVIRFLQEAQARRPSDDKEYVLLVTALDFADYYNRVPVKPGRLTVARTLRDTLRYNVIPTGAAPAPGVAQEISMRITAGERRAHTMLDDLTMAHWLVLSRAVSEQVLADLQTILVRIDEVEATLNLKKSIIGARCATVCGYDVSVDGYCISAQAATSLARLKIPDKVHGWRSVMSSFSWAKPFVRNFSALAQPLYAFTEKGKPQLKDLDAEARATCETQFLTLRAACASPEKRGYLDVSEGAPRIILTTDAAKAAYGYVIEQGAKLIAVGSGRFTETQVRWTNGAKELAAGAFSMRDERLVLIGRSFTWATDHYNFVHYMRNLAAPDGVAPDVAQREARLYINTMAIFQFDVVPRRGGKDPSKMEPAMAWADSLSRLEASLFEERFAAIGALEEGGSSSVAAASELEKLISVKATPMLDLVEVSAAQEAALDLMQKPYNAVRAKTYRRGNITWLRRKDGSTVPVLPVGSITKAHVGTWHRSFGHIGANRLEELGRVYFYVPSWQKLVRDTLEECDFCKLREKIGKPTSARQIGAPTPALAPWFEVEIDTLGPFWRACCKTQARYVYVLVDKATSYVVAMPVTKNTSSGLAEVLMRVFMILGPPRVLRCDGGPENVGEATRELLERCGVEVARGAPGQATAQGLVEGMHRNILKAIEAHTAAGFMDWSVAVVEWAARYNATPHSTTKIMPSSAFLGRELGAIYSAALGRDPAAVQRFIELEKVRALAIKRKNDVQNVTNASANLEKSVVRFEVGEPVFIVDRNASTHKGTRVLDAVTAGTVVGTNLGAQVVQVRLASTGNVRQVEASSVRPRRVKDETFEMAVKRIMQDDKKKEDEAESDAESDDEGDDESDDDFEDADGDREVVGPYENDLERQEQQHAARMQRNLRERRVPVDYRNPRPLHAL